MNPPETNITLRPFQPADIPLAMELKNIAGWNQTARDWTDCLNFDPEGCFVAECNGRAIGIVTSIRYGWRFGWIGMVLVHPECRRLGIGTMLLRAATRNLQECGTECVKLDATPMGRNVYVPMGFMDEYPIYRYEGVAMATGVGVAPGVQAMSPADLADIIAFDAPLFGSERPAVLRSLSGRDSGYCFVWRDDSGVVRGYLMAREGQNAVHLGPWLANGTGVAADLLRAFLEKSMERWVFVDVPHPNAAGIRLIESFGFQVQPGFMRMFLGDNRHPGLPEFVFGTSGTEKG